MRNLMWFSDGEFTIGVEPNVSPRVIADVLSASFDIPLKSDALLTETELTVGSIVLKRIPEPVNPYIYDRIVSMSLTILRPRKPKFLGCTPHVIETLPTFKPKVRPIIKL